MSTTTTQSILPPERRASLYLGIARRLRGDPGADSISRAALMNAWEAICELSDEHEQLSSALDSRDERGR